MAGFEEIQRSGELARHADLGAAADAIVRSDWPGYRPARDRDPLFDYPAPDAWDTYALYSERLARAERWERFSLVVRLTTLMALLAGGSFALGAWWAQ